MGEDVIIKAKNEFERKGLDLVVCIYVYLMGFHFALFDVVLVPVPKRERVPVQCFPCNANLTK